MIFLLGTYSNARTGWTNMRKKGAVWLLAAVLLAESVTAAAAATLPVEAPSVLLMEKTTGQVLYSQNEHERREPASVTKVMTLLLTMEAM